MLLTCSFLCSVFIMSQASTTTAMTTTPPVTVVHSSMSCLLSVVTMAPSLMGLSVISGQHDAVLLPTLTPRNPGGVVGPAIVLQQQPQSQMPLQAYANYAMGPPQVDFSFRVEHPTILFFYMFGGCSGVCFLFSGAMLDAVFTHGGSCSLVMIIGPNQVCTEWLLPPLLWEWGNLLLLNQLSSSHSNYMVGIQFGGLVESLPIPPPSLPCGEGSSIPGLVPSDDTVDSESVMCIKPGDSGVMIGYQVDGFTHTWSAEQFAACFHIYPGFTGKLSSLTHFPWVWVLFLSRPTCCWLWTGLGFHSHWFHWDTRIWHILGWAWCCYIFSLFWGSPLS